MNLIRKYLGEGKVMYQVEYLLSNEDNWKIEKGFRSKKDAAKWAKGENIANLSDEWKIDTYKE